MHDPRGRQATFNTHSFDRWDAFASHRARVTALLAAPPGRAGTRLCVLGTGNANDLDLPRLLHGHREVHLVDLDGEALQKGATRQGVSDHPRLFRHGGLDVTGMLDVVSAWSPLARIETADLAALAEWPASRVPPTLPGGFDRVASTCLISQILETAGHALGRDHPRLAEVERALLLGHLRLLAALAVPGGTASLIAEVVSSDSVPGLAAMEDAALADLLPRLARAQTHFRGVHPAELARTIREDRVLAAKIIGRESPRPWLWNLHARHYLVSATTMRVGARSF